MSGLGLDNNPVPLGSRVSEAANEAKAKNKSEAVIGAAVLGGVGTAAIASMQARAFPAGIAGGVAGAIAGAALGGAIAAGMSIKLPGNEVYTIKSGDTLSDIARKSIGDNATAAEIDAFVDKIVNLNADIIKNENEIYTGDQIAIPKAANKAGSAKSEISFLD